MAILASFLWQKYGTKCPESIEGRTSLTVFWNAPRNTFLKVAVVPTMYLYAHCTTAHHGWWEKGAKCPQWDSHWEEGEVFNCILKYKQNTSRNTNRNTRVLFVCTTAQHGWWQKRGEVSTMGRGGRPGRLVPYFIRALCPPHRAYTPCNTPPVIHTM